MESTLPNAREESARRINFAEENAVDICAKALSVFDGLSSGKHEIAFASELSNSLGKANAAVGNLLKAEDLSQKAVKLVKKSEKLTD